MGREFWQTAVLDLTPELEVPAVGRHLGLLEERGLIRRLGPTGGREDAFRFHHVLIRDVAYGAIPKMERSGLHEAVAEWLEAAGDADDELVGYHLEQAYECRTEVRAGDRHTRMLAADAAERLGAAGMRALKRADVYASANLLRRATALRVRDPVTVELTIERAVAERSAGRIDEACGLLQGAIDDAVQMRDRRLELRAEIELVNIRLHTSAGEDRGNRLLDLARTSLPVFEQARDDRATGRAWLLIGDVEGAMLGRMAAWADAAERAKTHYERAGWPPSTCRPKIAAALYHGPVAAPKAIRRCEALELEAADDRFSEAGVLVFHAGLLGMRGKFGEARDLLARARQTFEELHAGDLFVGLSDSIAAKTEMLAGKYAEAERILRATCELYEQRAEQSNYATMAGELAQTLYAQDKLDGAGEVARSAAERSAPDDYSAQVSWRSVEAKILARRGRISAGEALARDAVAIAAQTDALNRHATALLDLAEIVRLDERAAESAQLTEEALKLYVKKGNTTAARKTRKLIQLAPL